MDHDRIIKTALMLACKYLREHPPMDVCDYPEIMSKCVIGGNLDDPDGIRWMRYFIEKAMEKAVEEDWL